MKISRKSKDFYSLSILLYLCTSVSQADQKGFCISEKNTLDQGKCVFHWALSDNNKTLRTSFGCIHYTNFLVVNNRLVKVTGTEPEFWNMVNNNYINSNYIPSDREKWTMRIGSNLRDDTVECFTGDASISAAIAACKQSPLPEICN